MCIEPSNKIVTFLSKLYHFIHFPSIVDLISLHSDVLVMP